MAASAASEAAEAAKAVAEVAEAATAEAAARAAEEAAEVAEAAKAAAEAAVVAAAETAHAQFYRALPARVQAALRRVILEEMPQLLRARCDRHRPYPRAMAMYIMQVISLFPAGSGMLQRFCVALDCVPPPADYPLRKIWEVPGLNRLLGEDSYLTARWTRIERYVEAIPELVAELDLDRADMIISVYDQCDAWIALIRPSDSKIRRMWARVFAAAPPAMQFSLAARAVQP